MEPLATVKLELGINAQRIIQQFQTHNKQLEDCITRGIEKALEEIVSDDNFENIIKEQTKVEIGKIVNQAVLSWDVRDRIQKSISQKIEEKIKDYADKIAENITKSLK